MAATRIGYHKVYRLSDDNSLIEIAPTDIPAARTIEAQVDALKAEQIALNGKLSAVRFGEVYKSAAPSQAGIYPLKITRFECSSEGNDEDGMCRQLTERLGNLKIITEVPFMRKGNVIFAIRSQGLVDPHTGQAASVDSLFGGGIYWRGTLNKDRYDYELIMFRSGKDKSIGRMTESIDLTRKLSDIDPGLYQSEVAYHLERESGDASGKPTLSRALREYGFPDELDQVRACYAASAGFGAAVAAKSGDLRKLAEEARVACLNVPVKRYYQAYEAYLQGIAYAPK